MSSSEALTGLEKYTQKYPLPSPSVSPTISTETSLLASPRANVNVPEVARYREGALRLPSPVVKSTLTDCVLARDNNTWNVSGEVSLSPSVAEMSVSVLICGGG